MGILGFVLFSPVGDGEKRSGSPLTLDDLFDRNFQVHDPGAKWINGKQKILDHKWKNGGCSVLISWSQRPSEWFLCWLFKYKSILFWPWHDFLPFCLRWRADLSQLWRRRFESQHTQQRDGDPDEKHNVCTLFYGRISNVLGCTEFSENS